MPKSLLPIGTSIYHEIWQDGIIIGVKNIGGVFYHVYFESCDKYDFCYHNDLKVISQATPNTIAAAQQQLLNIQNRKPAGDLRIGTRIISSAYHLPDIEYIILDNGQPDTSDAVYLAAFRETNKTTWFLDYMPETGTRFINGQKENPTPKSIQQAKQILFERVISPAFTVI